MDTFFHWIRKNHTIEQSNVGELARLIVANHKETERVSNNIISWHEMLKFLQVEDKIYSAFDVAWKQYTQSL